MVDLVSIALTGAGIFFFVAGTAGLLRFPDTHCRLHALTKADNLGLGLIILGLAVQVGSFFVIVKLALIWALAILAAATTSQLIARVALSAEFPPRHPETGPEDHSR
jgi:multicomponent Na+:H+ antiporter subunit G